MNKSHMISTDASIMYKNNAYNKSCNLKSYSKDYTTTESQIMTTQSNIVALHRHLNKLKPRIAVLQMMKQKVNSATMVQKMLRQTKIFSDYERNNIKMQKNKIIKQTRKTNRENRQFRKQYFQSESTRLNKQFRLKKQQINYQRKSQQNKLRSLTKDSADRVRKQHKYQKQKLQRYKLFQQKRAHSFHQQKLRKQQYNVKKKQEQAQSLTAIWKDQQKQYYRKKPLRYVRSTQLQMMIRSIEEQLQDLKNKQTQVQ